MSGPTSGRSPGLIASLRNAGATAVALVRTRLELLAIELQEEGARFTRMLLLGFVALFFGALGLALLTLFLILVFWDTHRLLVTGMLAFVYLAIAAAIGLYLRNLLMERPRLFEASLGELDKDRQELLGP